MVSPSGSGVGVFVCDVVAAVSAGRGRASWLTGPHLDARQERAVNHLGNGRADKDIDRHLDRMGLVECDETLAL